MHGRQENVSTQVLPCWKQRGLKIEGFTLQKRGLRTKGFVPTQGQVADEEKNLLPCEEHLK